MCKGKNVYHGPALGVLPYFNMQGYQCELHDNPADFALDVLIDATQNSDSLDKLSKAYLGSPMQTNINYSLFRKKLVDDDFEKPHRKEKETAKRSITAEFFYLSQRTLKNVIKNPALLVSQIVVSIILGVLVGLVFNNMDKTIDPGVQNRLGAIFFIVVSNTFSSITALEPLMKERVLFIHVS